MNYIAITGALYGLGQDRDRPHFPGNLLGDFGGGSTYLVIGVLAALLEAQDQRSGARSSTPRSSTAPPTSTRWPRPSPRSAWPPTAARSGLLDGGTPYYDVYETADGKHVSVGALEPQFYDDARRRASASSCPTATTRPTSERSAKPSPRAFKERTQAEWVEVFDGTDACVRRDHPADRGARPPAPRCSRHVRRARRRHPAGPGAAVLAYALVPHDAAGRAARHPHPRGAGPPGAWTSDELIASGAATQA